MVSLRVVVCFAALAAASATEVLQCPGKNIPNLTNDVQLSPCKKAPCKLKKGTSQHITINFTPEIDMEDVTNHVTAEVFGVPLPFVGVDGNSICNKIFTEDDKKASCPIKAGTKYVYKDSFPILEFYPNIQVRVHWGLRKNGGGDDEFMCFEVPAKIMK